MNGILTEIVGLLVSGFTSFSAGIGAGLNDFVTNMFLATGAEGAQELSTLGGIIVVFAGISLTIGISKLIFNWLTSFGK